MKKIYTIMLCITMCITLFSGCNGNLSTEQPGTTTSATTTQATTTVPEVPALLVGYSRTDISPQQSVPLRGYGNSSGRWSTEVTEPLGAACTAFTDEAGNTVLLFHVDLCVCDNMVTGTIRKAISKETGVPQDNIMVAATHTHSAPDVDLSRSYQLFLKEQMLQAATEALADRKPATMHIATAYPKDLNWIRYYNYSDGTYGSGTVPKGATRVSHYRETDNQLQMIKFIREGGKDVILVNWQGHPHRDGDDEKTNVSADIVGSMRTFVETNLDCHFAYFTGASGNVNNHSYIKGVTTTADYVEHGQALGQFVLDAQFTQVNTGDVKLIAQTYKADAKSGGVSYVPQYVFSIGDVAFAVAPYEMFDTSGQAIKEGSPYTMTFIATCANASCGYFPTEFAYDATASYEVRVSKVAKGTAEIMEKEYVRMLNDLFNLPAGDTQPTTP